MPRRLPLPAPALALLLAVLAYGDGVLGAVPSPPDPEALAADLDRILAQADLGQTVAAVRVIDLGPEGAGARPRAIYSRRPDASLVPASNMKLVTTAACFDRFGPDWRLRTHVGRIPSPQKKGRWDLVVIGGGDPNISGRFWGGDAVGALVGRRPQGPRRRGRGASHSR